MLRLAIDAATALIVCGWLILPLVWLGVRWWTAEPLLAFAALSGALFALIVAVTVIRALAAAGAGK